MNFKKRFSMAAESLVALCMAAILAVACNGGGAPAVPVYTVSAGVGEVLQLTVDTSNMVYSYSVLDTSYASSVGVGQNSTGTLLGSNPDGTYNLGPSLDHFIQSGKVLQINGELAGRLSFSTIGGSANVPVIGISNPIANLVFIAGVYNYQGFSCSAPGIGNAASAIPPTACSSQYGTMTIAVVNPVNPTSAIYTTCVSGDITNQAPPSGHPCTGTPLIGTIQATSAATPGVYNLFDAGNNHIGWFFAFTAPNGQNVGVIDHDDAFSTPNEYGHTVLSAYAPLTTGAGDGSYYVNNNEEQENWVTLATTLNLITYSGPLPYITNYTSTAQPGYQGTLTPNTPWTGLSTYAISSVSATTVSGVAMVTGTGVYTQTSSNDPALFGVGVR